MAEWRTTLHTTPAISTLLIVFMSIVYTPAGCMMPYMIDSSHSESLTDNTGPGGPVCGFIVLELILAY